LEFGGLQILTQRQEGRKEGRKEARWIYEKITFRGAPGNGEKILQEVICIHTGNFMYCDGEYSRWRMKRDANRGGRGAGGRVERESRKMLRDDGNRMANV